MKKNNPDEGLAVIKDGKELFQNDFDLIIAETNIYLGTNQNAKAKKNLKVAIEKDPNNSTIWFAYGTIYDTEHNIDSAEIAYKKAIELKPDYFDPIYNIGALYVNKASEILEAANKLPFEETQKYEAEKIKADSFLRMSIPYLEKALEMQPNDKNTLISLKEIYTRLQIYDKLKVINAKIEEIKK
jgi:Tfp pilus assembly protein PilF